MYNMDSIYRSWSTTAIILFLLIFILVIDSTYSYNLSLAIQLSTTVPTSTSTDRLAPGCCYSPLIIGHYTLSLEIRYYLLSNAWKDLWDIKSGLGTCLKKHESMLICKLFPHFRCYFSLVIWHIHFICYQHLFDIGERVLINLLQPTLYIIKSTFLSTVVYQ